MVFALSIYQNYLQAKREGIVSTGKLTNSAQFVEIGN
jgi:hypothetical protein